MSRIKKNDVRPKISERFYEGISLPAQMLALGCDALLAHETLRRALSGSSSTTSILVAVAIAAVIVECSSQAANQRSKQEMWATRALMGIAFAVAAVIFVLRVFAGFGSGGQTSSVFSNQSSSWTDFLTNAMISLLMAACVCASILGVYYTRFADIKAQNRKELYVLKSEMEAREENQEAYDVELDIETAMNFVAAVHERARSIVIARAAILSPEIADVYELSAKQVNRVHDSYAQERRPETQMNSFDENSDEFLARHQMSNAA